ncbi:MAG: hypothetical protein IPI43_25285 [Sandaracinaceae bacterium]|nr:hypothetical protein [Sandaracinaceae bacterium]
MTPIFGVSTALPAVGVEAQPHALARHALGHGLLERGITCSCDGWLHERLRSAVVENFAAVVNFWDMENPVRAVAQPSRT